MLLLLHPLFTNNISVPTPTKSNLYVFKIHVSNIKKKCFLLFSRIQPVPETIPPCTGLKIKIPKDKIKTESITELTQQSIGLNSQPTMGIKLKIPKEKLNNCISLETNPKKRERDKTSPTDAPPAKISKTNYKDSKQNGRHSYNKVSQSSTMATSHPTQRFSHSPLLRPTNYVPQLPPNGGISNLMSLDAMRPPVPNPTAIYYYPSMAPPPPPPPTLPNMSVPPPNMYHYYHQGYMYAPEYFSQSMLPTAKNLNPPLPREAPPSHVPPPPPPE